MQFPWQHGADCGCRADASAGLEGRTMSPAPGSQSPLQHGPNAHSPVCTGTQGRWFPGEPQPHWVTNAPLPPLLPPERAECLAPGLQGGPCENGGGAAAQGDRSGDNDQGEENGVRSRWSLLHGLLLLPDASGRWAVSRAGCLSLLGRLCWGQCCWAGGPGPAFAPSE